MTTDEADKLFQFKHLPPHLQDVSKPFHELAMHLCMTMDSSPFRTKALNDLWAAKNWAVAGAVWT